MTKPILPLYFDIETGGFSAYSTSINSLAWQRGKERGSQFANPVIGTRVGSFSQGTTLANKNWKQAAKVSEEELLKNWISTLKGQAGGELRGWNIGYNPFAGQLEIGERGRAPSGFDLPFTLTTANKYGLLSELRAAYAKVAIRDMGREYAVSLTEQLMAAYRRDPTILGHIDPQLMESFHKYEQAIINARKVLTSKGLPIDTGSVAKFLGENRGFMVGGWKLQNIFEVLTGKSVAGAHEANFDVSMMTKLEEMGFDPRTHTFTESQLKELNKRALESTLVNQAVTHRYRAVGKQYEELAQRASSAGIGNFEQLVEEKIKLKIGTSGDVGKAWERVRAGLGVQETWTTFSGRVKEGVGRAAESIGGKKSFAALAGESKVVMPSFKGLAMVGGGAAAAAVIGGALFSGWDDSYNTIEGFPHRGLAPQMRKVMTPFGSGWKGISSAWAGLPSAIHGQPIDPSLLEFRATTLDDAEQKALFEQRTGAGEGGIQGNLGKFKPEDWHQFNIGVTDSLNRRNQQLKIIRLAQFQIDVEDADTLILRRRESFIQRVSSLLSGENNDIQVRLAGIDAPETAGHSADPLEQVRIWQQQPYGEEATNYLRTRLAEMGRTGTLTVDTGRKTYGRYLGVLAGGGGENINLELIRAGAASALPFGNPEEDILQRGAAAKAEEQAYQDRTGMWAYKRYQAERVVTKTVGRALTHNTLTRKDKMAENLNLGALGTWMNQLGSATGDLTTEETSKTRQLSQWLRQTHGQHPGKLPRNKAPNGFSGAKSFLGKIWSKTFGETADEVPESKVPSLQEGYGQFNGLSEGTVATKLRHEITVFGTPTNLIKAVNQAEKLYKKQFLKAFKQTGVSTKGITWDSVKDASTESASLVLLAKSKEGKFLAGTSRESGKGEVYLSSIEVSANLPGGLGKALYEGESRILHRLGYKADEKITSAVSSPITARWQMQLYKSRFTDPERVQSLTGKTIEQYSQAVLNKEISKEYFIGGVLEGRIPVKKSWWNLKSNSTPNGIEGFQHGGMSSDNRKNFGFGSRSIGGFVRDLAAKVFKTEKKLSNNLIPNIPGVAGPRTLTPIPAYIPDKPVSMASAMDDSFASIAPVKPKVSATDKTGVGGQDFASSFKTPEEILEAEFQSKLKAMDQPAPRPKLFGVNATDEEYKNIVKSAENAIEKAKLEGKFAKIGLSQEKLHVQNVLLASEGEFYQHAINAAKPRPAEANWFVKNEITPQSEWSRVMDTSTIKRSQSIWDRELSFLSRRANISVNINQDKLKKMYKSIEKKHSKIAQSQANSQAIQAQAMGASGGKGHMQQAGRHVALPPPLTPLPRRQK